MGRRKKVELIDNVPILEEGAPLEENRRTKRVKVNQVTRREFVEEVPIVEDENEAELIEGEEGEEESALPEIFQSFDDIVENAENAQLRLWRLPHFERDGRTSPRNANRIYCGQIEYHAGDISVMEKIAAMVREGGTVQCELIGPTANRSYGVLRKGLVTIEKHPEPPPNPFVIQTGNGTPGYTPLEIAKQQMSFAKDLYQMAREMMPQQAAAQIAPAGEAPNPDTSAGSDRLLEAVLVRALEGDKVPESRLDRVLDALTGRREKPTGFADSLAPVIGDLVKHLGPAIGVMAQRWAIAQPGPPLPAGSAPAPPAPGSAPGVAPLTPGNTPDTAWMKVIRRMVEDLADGCAATASAEAIVDLLDRFPQFEPQVEALVAGEPGAVIELCAMVMASPQESQFVASLKEHPQALEWVRALQTEVKAILQESAEADGEAPVEIIEEVTEHEK